MYLSNPADSKIQKTIIMTECTFQGKVVTRVVKTVVKKDESKDKGELMLNNMDALEVRSEET